MAKSNFLNAMGMRTINSPALTVVSPITVVPDTTVSPPTTVTEHLGEEARKPSALKGVTVFLARTVQDGHTRAEQALYQTMWNQGSPEQGSPGRLVQMGMRELELRARGSQNQIRRNLRSLQAKLSIEPVSTSDPLTARRYRIFHYGQILERRRAAGLIWVLRSRGSVDLACNAIPPITVTGPTTVRPPATMRADDSVAPVGPTTVIAEPPTTVAVPLNKEFLNKKTLNQSSSSPAPEIVTALRSFDPGIDDDGTLQFIGKCQRVCPDVTNEELVDHISMKGKAASNVKSWLGYLKEAVPKCLVGESFRQYRESAAGAGRTPAAVYRPDQVEEARRILAAPESKANDRLWAERVLEAMDL